MRPLRFDNRGLRELPGDPASGGGARQVHGAAWSRVAPTPVAAPRLLAASADVAALLGLTPADVASDGFAATFAGNRLAPGMEAYAANYGGHQFGSWAGQLGDGRAIGLGEVIGSDGQRHELQLKGAGPTPYSRFADGRAVLRSSLREFVCSEAMHALGVPTTRALSLVATGEPVVRDLLYQGDPRPEPGAVVCRVAPSFLRFGSFELPAARGDHALLARLVDFCIARDFPELRGPDARADWFGEIAARTGRLVAHWLRVGFVHGVMNTDNMSVLGLTIDYGPYGFLDEFDAAFTPNITDAGGKRYCFGRQPAIARWNLECLARAIAPLFPDAAALDAGLARYAEAFNAAHAGAMAAKLGLAAWRDAADLDLVGDLFDVLADATADYTIFFRRLADVDPAAPDAGPLADAFYLPERRARADDRLRAWLARWGARVLAEDSGAGPRRARMAAANPWVVPRNWLAQEAIEAAEGGDLAPLHALVAVLRTPYAEQPGHARYAARRPEWARHKPGCAMLSCSS
jgi:uncharacterized protein YdiU (UPF0061 family)